MKKKILIVALIATMLVTMLALPAFADELPGVSNEANDWKYQYVMGSGEGYLPKVETPFETHFKVVGGSHNGYFVFNIIDRDELYTFDSRDYDYDYMTIHAYFDGNQGMFDICCYKGGQRVCVITTGEENSSDPTIDVNGHECYYSDYSDYEYFFGFKDTYVKNLGASKVSATYYSDASAETIVDIFSKYLGQATYGDNVEQRPVNLINMMFGGFTPAVEGLAGGMKDGVAYLLWENPTASVKSLSNFSIFIFVIAGLSIAMTVFFLIFRLIRHGKQR